MELWKICNLAWNSTKYCTEQMDAKACSLAILSRLRALISAQTWEYVKAPTAKFDQCASLGPYPFKWRNSFIGIHVVSVSFLSPLLSPRSDSASGQTSVAHSPRPVRDRINNVSYAPTPRPKLRALSTLSTPRRSLPRGRGSPAPLNESHVTHYRLDARRHQAELVHPFSHHILNLNSIPCRGHTIAVRILDTLAPHSCNYTHYGPSLDRFLA